MTKLHYYTENGIRLCRVVTVNAGGQVVEVVMDPALVVELPGFGPSMAEDEGLGWVLSEEEMNPNDGGPVVGAPEETE